MTLPSYAMGQLSFPELYERHIVPKLFEPWAKDLLEIAGLAGDARVLDVACGTGIVARLAKARLGPQGTVVGVDVSAPMIALAREIEPAADWRVGDAAALPVADTERFDRVFCQQGMQFFADRAGAAREMRRVLADGALAIVATWRSLEENRFVLDMQRAAEPFVGTFTDERHGLGDGAELGRLLETGGFRDVDVKTFVRMLTFDDPGALVRMNAMAIVGMSGAGEGLDDLQRAELVEAIVQESESALRAYVHDGRASFELKSNVAVARA